MQLPPLLAACANGSREDAAETLAVLSVLGRAAREKQAGLYLSNVHTYGLNKKQINAMHRVARSVRDFRQAVYRDLAAEGGQVTAGGSTNFRDDVVENFLEKHPELEEHVVPGGHMMLQRERGPRRLLGLLPGKREPAGEGYVVGLYHWPHDADLATGGRPQAAATFEDLYGDIPDSTRELLKGLPQTMRNVHVPAIPELAAHGKQADFDWQGLLNQGKQTLSGLWADPRSQATLVGAGLGAGLGGLKALSDRPEDHNTLGSVLTGTLAGTGIGAGIGYGIPAIEKARNEVPPSILKSQANLAQQHTAPWRPMEETGPATKILNDTTEALSNEYHRLQGMANVPGTAPNEASMAWNQINPYGATGSKVTVPLVAATAAYHGPGRLIRKAYERENPLPPDAKFRGLRNVLRGTAPRDAAGNLHGPWKRMRIRGGHALGSAALAHILGIAAEAYSHGSYPNSPAGQLSHSHAENLQRQLQQQGVR